MGENAKAHRLQSFGRSRDGGPPSDMEETPCRLWTQTLGVLRGKFTWHVPRRVYAVTYKRRSDGSVFTVKAEKFVVT